VSWRSIAVHLADRGAACVFVDRTFHVRLFSLGLERMVGWARDEIEGHPWIDALVPPEQQQVVLARMERALAGTLPVFESLVRTKDGRLVVLSLESSAVGHAEKAGLLMTAVSSRAISPPGEGSGTWEVAYEVDVSVSAFGTLSGLRSMRHGDDISWPAGERCYRVLRDRSEPCADCPLLQPPANPWPRTVTRRLAGKSETYEVITAALRGQRAQVRARHIPGEVVSAIHEAKVDCLARDAGLSEREREVLRYLLLGRSLADIALIMKISLRTVKFHQANVLEKLGVDSRSDLLRLVL
jgi:PAS domain S-box-containing protein